MFDFIKVLEHSSFFLIGYKRYWELLRGAYNDNFNKIAKEKNTKNVVENLWIFIRKV